MATEGRKENRMPLPAKVLPGDLITADYMNQIIDLLALHEQEIQALLAAQPGATGAIGIAATIPAGLAHIGDAMRVLGHGFGLPSQSTVTIETTPVTLEAGSNDTQLLFHIPVVPGIPDAGRNVTLRVTAGAGQANTSFLLLPAPPLTTGDMSFAIKPPAVASILAGQTYDFVCTIQAVTTQDDKYTLSASAGAGTAAWTVAVTDANQGPLPSIAIPRSTTPFSQDVHLRVTIPNGATGQGMVSLTVTCQSNPAFAKSSGQFTFSIGAAPPPPPTINVLFTATSGFNAVTPDANGVLNLAVGQEADFIFSATLAAGKYDLALKVQDGTNVWNARLLQGTPLTWSGGNAQISASLTPASGAPDTLVTFTVTSQSDSTQFGAVTMKVHAK
jgi:hypothetical protein